MKSKFDPKTFNYDIMLNHYLFNNLPHFYEDTNLGQARIDEIKFYKE
jgi:hypothetical protein